MKKLRIRAWLEAGLAALTLASLFFAPNTLAQQQADTVAIKAAFVYNFAKFTEWPANAFPAADSPLNLCLITNEKEAAPFDAIAGRAAQGHSVVLKREAKLQDTSNCHIVFVGESAQKQLPAVVKSAQTGSVLTVSDMDGFAQAGGMIGLFVADNKVRFEINPEAATRANLRISAQLLKLARIVKTGAQ
jgi:ribosome-associated protein YbcJ (S4-like RNA binding protein)